MSAQRPGPQPASDRSGQAVVLGGGMAGILAARVLADTFEQVTIIERHDDRSVAPPALAQIFSEPARSQLERLFPGLSAELAADGAAIGALVSQQGPTRPAPGVRRDGARLQFTQRFIQRHLSRRLNTLDAIVMLSGCDAVGLVSDGQRCVGTQVLPRSRSAAARTIPADLLVDAMGTGSRLSLWLTELWGTRIPIERYEVLLATDALDAGETAGAATSYTTTPCLLRRFDLAERLPTGLIALGSSLCCLDPRSERGLVVAVLHATMLQQLLAEDDAGSAGRCRLVPRRYFDAVMRVPSWLTTRSGPW